MEPALADSNILLRLMQPAHPEHAVTSAAVDKLMEQGIDLYIVGQNLVEFWAVATRPSINRGGFGWKPDTVDAQVTRLRGLFRLLEGATGIVDSWQKLVRQHQVSGRQVHDAHLVAAMQTYGVKQILTFNGDDFKRYPGIIVLNPATV